MAKCKASTGSAVKGLKSFADANFRVGVEDIRRCSVQSCELKFGSWTYDGFMLDISFFDDRAAVDTSDYVISNEWELVENPGKRNVQYYACCGDHPYPDLTFTLKLRRLSAFYNYTIMLPCFLLSCLTVVIFWLPPESPAKIMLGLSVSPLEACTGMGIAGIPLGWKLMEQNCAGFPRERSCI